MAGGTLMTMRMLAPDAAARDAMIASGMTNGMETSCARLDDQMQDDHMAEMTD